MRGNCVIVLFCSLWAGCTAFQLFPGVFSTSASSLQGLLQPVGSGCQPVKLRKPRLMGLRELKAEDKCPGALSQSSRRTFLESVAVSALVLGSKPASAKSGELVLVVGASGGIGQYATRELLKQGYRVRGLTRFPEEAQRVLGSEVEWVQADLNKPETLAPVMPGVSKVIFAAGAHGWEDIENNRRIYYEAVGELARLSAAQGVTSFALVSSGGVTTDSPNRSKYLKDVLKWKLRGENLLRSCGVPYAIVRAYSLDNRAESKPKTSSTAATPTQTSDLVLNQGDKTDEAGLITRQDLAVVSVQALLLPDLGRGESKGVTFEVFDRNAQFFACQDGQRTCVGRIERPTPENTSKGTSESVKASKSSDSISSSEDDNEWRRVLLKLRPDKGLQGTQDGGFDFSSSAA